MNVDKQALREAAEKAMHDDWGFDTELFHELVTPSIVLALLDELEAKDKQIAELVAGRQNLQRMMGVYVHAYEEAKEQIAKDVEIKARLCIESNSLFDRLRAAEKRIADQQGIILSARKFISEYAASGDAGAAEFVKLIDRAVGIGKGE